MRRPFQAAFLIAVPAATLVTQGILGAAAAEECRSRPSALAPIGSHWYYRIDRSNQRRCWFLRSNASGLSRAYSLRHREINISGSTETAIAQQAETDESIVARSSSPQESAVVVPDQQSSNELTATQPEASEVLVPHKVTSISYSRPRAQEPSLRRGISIGLAFLFGALATVSLVAGGALQIAGRIRQRSGASLKWRSPRATKEKRIKRQFPIVPRARNNGVKIERATRASGAIGHSIVGNTLA